MNKTQNDGEVPLLLAVPLMQRVVLGNFRQLHFPYTKSQLYVQIALRYRGSLTMKEVAGHLCCSKEQATRAVAPLADDGLIERRIDEENRSRIHVCLTPEGEELLREYVAQLSERIDEYLCEALDEEERRELHEAVDVVLRILGKL